MSFTEPSFTVGIEEEYLLVDPATRDVVREPPDEMLAECEKRLGDLVRPEFLRSQIEVGTRVCRTVPEARSELAELRGGVNDVARAFDFAIVAASTHPFAQWQDQVHTNKARSSILARDMQAVARRLLICGMHVHVGIDDDELRIDLLNQVGYFLPHLLALSTSSPFWLGENTGLRSYRLGVFDELPRTGLPESFASSMEYSRHVDVLVRAGLIEDATMLWWDVRPSVRFPTLEMRITDVCTRLDDAATIAALYVSVLRMLYRLRRDNQRWRQYAAMLVNENRWRAQRYGLHDGLVDFGKGKVVDYTALLEELIELVREDTGALGCVEDVERSREILARGTSADRQIAVFDRAMADGADHHRALEAVVDMLIDETVEGV